MCMLLLWCGKLVWPWDFTVDFDSQHTYHPTCLLSNTLFIRCIWTHKHRSIIWQDHILTYLSRIPKLIIVLHALHPILKDIWVTNNGTNTIPFMLWHATALMLLWGWHIVAVLPSSCCSCWLLSLFFVMLFALHCPHCRVMQILEYVI